MKLPANKHHWIFAIALILFVIAKLPHLHYPFYWDESWVYAPAIHMMYAHGPSLMPDAIPVIYSRGHPLLFHAACAAWMQLLGPSNFSMHCFALAVALALVIVVYYVLARLFSSRVALLAGILLLCNSYFFAESSFLLTDISLALFALLSLYHYVRGNHVLTALFLTLLFFTKESGLAICAILAIDIIAGVARRKITITTGIAKALSVAAPLLILGAFFVMQKRINGWYLYPEHISAIQLELSNTLSNIIKSVSLLYFNEQRYTTYILIGVLLALVAIRHRKWHLLLYILYGVLLYVTLILCGIKDLMFYVFMLVSIGLLIRFFVAKLNGYNTTQVYFIRLVAAFSIAYGYFCCVNFYEPRYLLPALFFVSVILVAILINSLLLQLSKPWLYPLVVALAAMPILYTANSNSVEMSAYSRMDVQQHLVDYMEQHNYYNCHICTTSFLESVHLTDPKTGFLRSAKVFTNVTNNVKPDTELFIYDNIDAQDPSFGNEAATELATNKLTLLYKYQNGDDWVAVYKR